MIWRAFLLGLLLGLLLAPAGAAETWRRLRDGLARSLDTLLRLASGN